MTDITTSTTSSDGGSTSAEPDGGWREAGDAWGHAAADWAFRFEPHTRDAVERVFGRLRVGARTRLLDVACGAGYAAGVADRLGATVAAIDASSQLIDIARRRAPAADLRVGDMFRLPWPDDHFDVVVSFNGIWGGCGDAIAEIARVLAPGGSFALTFWGPGRSLDLRDVLIAYGRTAPDVGGDLKELAAIGAPGVLDSMLAASGLEAIEQGTTTSVLEFADDDDAWRVLRSPGVAIPSLRHSGEETVRAQVLEAIGPFRADDGSYRLTNHVVHTIVRHVDR